MTTSLPIIGVDLVDCGRIARMLEEDTSFLDLAFTAGEQEDVGQDPARLGARWAVKEATMKALGRGVGKIAPRDIEVHKSLHGAPILELSGSAKARAHELGITDWSVSLSHESGFAVAFVIMMKAEPHV